MASVRGAPRPGICSGRSAPVCSPLPLPEVAAMGRSAYETELEKNAANHAPLTPLVFLDWAADVYPDKIAVLHGARRFTWRETRSRCRRLASALVARGVVPGDTVAILAANIPEM